IAYFYGAVFVPNKICLVTQFAEYGSLQNLMNNNKKTQEINIKVKTKICLDSSKGISYLHENGIIHRDIKPDNILVFTLDPATNIIAKLTDFGSARNVNTMITDMTFTKGIGTPVYMAPEVLKQEKYTKSADVYSFSITMYECFGWSEAYNTKRFHFSWNIAEFVVSGNRLERREEIPEEIYEMIQMCWNQNPRDRCTIQSVIYCLQIYFETH
ncbi:tyrosine kinase, putative, partial [Entamoeba invadens IP1]